MPTGTGEGAPPTPRESYPVLDELKATPISKRREFLGGLTLDQQAALFIALIAEGSYDEERLTPILKGIIKLPGNADRIREFEDRKPGGQIDLLLKLIAATEPPLAGEAPAPVVPTLLHALESMSPKARRGLFESLPTDMRRAYLLQDLETQGVSFEEAGRIVGITDPLELRRYLDLFSTGESAGSSFRERMLELHEFLDRLYLVSHTALAKRMGVPVDSEDFRTLRSYVLQVRNSVRHINALLKKYPEPQVRPPEDSA